MALGRQHGCELRRKNFLPGDVDPFVFLRQLAISASAGEQNTRARSSPSLLSWRGNHRHRKCVGRQHQNSDVYFWCLMAAGSLGVDRRAQKTRTGRAVAAVVEGDPSAPQMCGQTTPKFRFRGQTVFHVRPHLLATSSLPHLGGGAHRPVA